MKIIENFIAKCVCKGVELYQSKYRFGIYGQLEIIPLTHSEFEKHLFNNVFQKQQQPVKDYLSRTTPTTNPHLEQITK